MLARLGRKKDGMTGEELIKFLDLEKAIGPDGEERVETCPYAVTKDRRHVVSLVASLQIKCSMGI